MSSQSRSTRLPERVVVGRVRRPHGVRGEITIEALTDVGNRFVPGSLLIAVDPDGSSRPLVVATTRRHRKAYLLRFEGLDDRDAVEPLRGSMLEVDRALVPPAPDDSYYYYELVGCRGVDLRAGDLGEVVDVVEDGGGLLLEFDSKGRRVLVPFVRAYLRSVDLDRGVIEFDLPEDLAETCVSTS